MVTNAGVAGPAVDVVAIAIIDADEAEPAGIDDLTGHAQGVLAVGSDARGRGRLVERDRRVAGTKEGAVGQRGVVGDDVAGKLVEDTRRSEGLPDHVRRLDRLAEAQAQPSELALDVVGADDARDGQGRRARIDEVIHGCPGIDESP